jgi:glycerol-3-phosphate dehydrogenase (NAD(P)+)
MRIMILGAGVMGSAISWPLSDNGHEIRLVGTHLDHSIIQSCKEKGYHPRLKRKLPKNVTPFYIEEIKKASDGVDFFVSGVNSNGVHWAGKTLAPLLKQGDKVIGITKGMEADPDGHLTILPEVLRTELPVSLKDQVSLAAIGGPCIAGELAGRRQSCVYFGCREIETAKFLADAFRTDYYHIWTTSDIVGLETAVAMKNAYATGVSLASGILSNSGGPDDSGAYMHNLAAALFAQGCIEIKCLLDAIGGNPAFAYSLPGAGDLFVTVQGGRSCLLGKLLGEGKTYQQAVKQLEGETLEAAMIVQQMAIALPKLEEKGTLNKKQMPFIHTLIDIIVNGQPVNLMLDQFFGEK